MKIETAELSQIEPSEAAAIKNTFEPMVEMLQGFEERFKELLKEKEENGIDDKITEKAKRLRLDIAQVRIQTGKLKDKQKEYIKLKDKAIMGVHNILVYAVKEKEDVLKSIEDHFDNIERERMAKLQAERVEELSKYVEDAEERNLGEMEEDVWEAYRDRKKSQWEDEQEAKRKAQEEQEERERKEKLYQERKEKLIPLWNHLPIEQKSADFGELTDEEFNAIHESAKEAKSKHDEEQERIRQENERIKKEEQEREQRRKDRSVKLDGLWSTMPEKYVSVRYEELSDKEFDEMLTDAKEAKQAQDIRIEEENRKKREREEQERKEIERREALEKELAERKRKEEEEQRRKEEEQQAELNKGDSEKVKDLISDLEEIRSKYQFKSKANKLKYQEVCVLMLKCKSIMEL